MNTCTRMGKCKFFFICQQCHTSHFWVYSEKIKTLCSHLWQNYCVNQGKHQSNTIQMVICEKGLLHTFSHFPFDFNVNTDTVTFVSWMMTFQPCRHKPVWTYLTTGQWGFSSCFIAQPNTVGFFSAFATPTEVADRKACATLRQEQWEGSFCSGLSAESFLVAQPSMFLAVESCRTWTEGRVLFWICGFGE